MGIRYSALPGHTTEMSEAMDEALSKKWRELRGIAIASFAVATVSAPEEDEQMIKHLQKRLFTAIPRWRRHLWSVRRAKPWSAQRKTPAQALSWRLPV